MSPRSLSFGTLEEVPEEGLFVFVSLSPGVFRKETQRKAKLLREGLQEKICPSWCSLSLGTSRGVPGEGLSAYL